MPRSIHRSMNFILSAQMSAPKKPSNVKILLGDILTFGGSASGLSLMRYTFVSAFESSSPSSGFARGYERQILNLAGFVEAHFQNKWIFPSILSQANTLIVLYINSRAKMAPDNLSTAGGGGGMLPRPCLAPEWMCVGA